MLSLWLNHLVFVGVGVPAAEHCIVANVLLVIIILFSETVTTGGTKN